MTERSWPWPGVALGDAGPYSDDEWDDMFEMRFGSGEGADYRNRGVIRNWANELEVIDPSIANQVNVDTGAALVHGKHYDNDAVVNIVGIPNSGAPWREDTILLRSLWATQTIRIYRHQNTGGDGVGYEIPASVDGTVWYIPLAAVRIDAAGAILSVTDLREYAYHRMQGAPAVRAYHNAAQSIPNAAYTSLAFNSEDFDTDALHDLAVNNSRLTATIPGKYRISANISFEENAAGFRLAAIRYNGVQLAAQQTIPSIGGAIYTSLSLTTTLDMAVGDYVEVRVYQSSGGALDVEYTSLYSPRFEMERIAD